MNDLEKLPYADAPKYIPCYEDYPERGSKFWKLPCRNLNEAAMIIVKAEPPEPLRVQG